ncbi:MAG TPA: 3-phosphoshikimate 1-carboxyvinyltransferase, partial [Myxococcaceae bacterium]|nr:3-phosphoshikimate 1-carboxyvinyltransferase [Myxococcaceae bacterium]
YSVLEGALRSDDTVYMTDALRALGVEIREDAERRTLTVRGCGGRLPKAEARVFIGNAGTAARFLPPVMALGRGTYRLEGSEAMRRRPIQPLLDALAALGAKAVSLEGNGCPPIQVEANGLRGGTARLPGGVSSQYFTGLLMAGPYAREGVTLEVEGELVSKPYLEVTAQAMRAFGVTLEREGFSLFRVASGPGYRATQYPVEPDASAASYFFAAAAVTGGTVAVPGLGSDSLQGDLRFVQLLERMGCRVRQTARETEVTGPQQLRGIEANMADLSDTAQTLAAVAPFAEGPTRVTGIGFIRRKETNRVAAVVTELKRLGIRAEEEPDGFVIYPGLPQPGRVETYQDHRMAMSFAVIGLRAPGVAILDPGCVSKTFPDFFQVLETLREA